jgi:hypothetical protein
MGMNLVIEHGDLKLTPEEVSAEILNFLKKCGQELIDITIPYNTNDPQILN